MSAPAARTPTPPPTPPQPTRTATAPLSAAEEAGEEKWKMSRESASPQNGSGEASEAENVFPVSTAAGSGSVFWSPFTRSRKRPGSWKHPGGTVSETEEWDNTSEPDNDRDGEREPGKIRKSKVGQNARSSFPLTRILRSLGERSVCDLR